MKKEKVLFILVLVLSNISLIFAENKGTKENDVVTQNISAASIESNAPVLTGYYTVVSDYYGSYPLKQTNNVPRNQQIRVVVTNTSLKSYSQSVNASQYGVNVTFMDEASREIIFVATQRSAPTLPIRYTLTFEDGKTYTYDYYFNFEN